MIHYKNIYQFLRCTHIFISYIIPTGGEKSEIWEGGGSTNGWEFVMLKLKRGGWGGCTLTQYNVEYCIMGQATRKSTFLPPSSGLISTYTHTVTYFNVNIPPLFLFLLLHLLDFNLLYYGETLI